jgi:hypothetical protein
VENIWRREGTVSITTRILGSAVGFRGAMQLSGFVVGTLVRMTLCDTSTPNITWLVLAVLIPLGLWMTVLLRRIPPHQELETIAQWISRVAAGAAWGWIVFG